MLFFSLLSFCLLLRAQLTRQALPMGMTCQSRIDCLRDQENDTWCDSGILCHRAQCLTVVGHPCSRVQVCDAQRYECVDRRCRHDSDCNDGRFCNGAEKCLQGRCVEDGSSDCYGGLCRETLHQCFLPEAMLQWRLYKRQDERLLQATAQSWHIAQQNNTGGNTGYTNAVIVVIVTAVVVASLFVVIFLVTLGRR